MNKQAKMKVKSALNDARYDHKAVESRWRAVWEKTGIDVADIKSAAKPYYNLMMFPYPSAEGLHVGNMYAFTGSDIYGRYKRMKGYDVFEPIGLDGFGIHSENFALKIGRHPMDHAAVTQKNFYNQLHKIGAMFDWTRTVETYDPDYYRWTQWLFVQMFKHGLAYRKTASVNWCPSDKTVLADEQVIDGRCERCGNLVSNKLLEQWFFRITAYAEKLLENSFKLDWSEKVRVAQQKWIGKKEGVVIHHKVEGMDLELDTFSAYPAWLWADTFIVISPDHPLVKELIAGSPQEKKIADFIVKCGQNKKDISKHTDEKEGVFTGKYAVDPINAGERMPIWVANFALMGFGTGVIRCSAHDPRDFAFAKKYKIPIKEVVVRTGEEPVNAHTNEGVLEQSGPFSDKKISARLIEEIMDWITEKGIGERQTSYHLRDWLISRQRYWGPPIPMIYCKKCAQGGRSWFNSADVENPSDAYRGTYFAAHPSNPLSFPRRRESIDGSQIKFGLAEGAKDMTVLENTRRAASLGEAAWDAAGWYPVDENDLPVILPRIEDYKPGDDGVAPLAKHKEFYETKCPGCGGNAVRETDVSDTFLDSSWYFLRYPSINLTVEDRRSKVGVEDRESKIDKSNPFSTFNPPLLSSMLNPRSSTLSPWDPEITKKWLPVAMYTGGAEHSVLHLMYSRFVTMALKDWGYLEFDEPFTKFFAHGLVIKDGAKMSKSKGNVVNPDEYIESYGADSLRLYLMFMGPFDQGGDFRDTAMEGVYRWVGRVWRMCGNTLDQQIKESSAKVNTALQKLIKRVGDDLEKRRYNTAIAGMMEFTNLVADENGALGLSDAKNFVKIMAPLAPFMAEELWAKLNGVGLPAGPLRREASEAGDSVHKQSWPDFDKSALKEESVTLVIQINGKVRAQMSLSYDDAGREHVVVEGARSQAKVKELLAGKTIQKTIFVPGKLVNFVV